MTGENIFENWTYIPMESTEEYDSKNKIFRSKEYSETRGLTFVREDLFKYNGELLLVIENMDKKNIATLLIPGFVRKHKIHPIPSYEREIVMNHLNRDNIDSGRKKMVGVFWNNEISMRGSHGSNKPSVYIVK